MIEIKCVTELIVRDTAGREASLTDIVPLLALVDETGSIAQAAEQRRMSYRHAWGLLRALEARLGGDLIAKERGKGSALSALGHAVLRAQQRCVERLDAPARAIASEVEGELNRRLGREGAVRIHASHGYAVAALVAELTGRDTLPVDIRYRGSAEAVAALAHGECDFAGFHLPRSGFRASCAAIYRRWLDDERHGLVHLTRRTQGIFLQKGNPRQVQGLSDLARGDLRFVNRQQGSGTRLLLDLALREIGIDPARIDGYASTELTHTAIAAFVASGMADAGFGVAPAAHHFGLDFIPVVDEDYYFAFERSRMTSRAVGAVLEVLASGPFRAQVSALEGYDPSECGALVDVPHGLRGDAIDAAPD